MKVGGSFQGFVTGRIYYLVYCKAFFLLFQKLIKRTHAKHHTPEATDAYYQRYELFRPLDDACSYVIQVMVFTFKEIYANNPAFWLVRVVILPFNFLKNKWQLAPERVCQITIQSLRALYIFHLVHTGDFSLTFIEDFGFNFLQTFLFHILRCFWEFTY